MQLGSIYEHQQRLWTQQHTIEQTHQRMMSQKKKKRTDLTKETQIS